MKQEQRSRQIQMVRKTVGKYYPSLCWREIYIMFQTRCRRERKDIVDKIMKFIEFAHTLKRK